ncbi:hypothetical protein [Cryobacterium sp. BB307]|uniref:hypothetical protein n=1 Tax=Cryobacterium sp. BB307 TaxID=2716317 RepID=UPI001446376D|nr:hypothetical protein [Cryobacterium sp. BB307]
MRLSWYHVVALISNLALGAIAMADTVVKGTTGGSIIPLEDPATGSAVLMLLVINLVHGVAYAALVFVLLKERARFAAANRFARVMRVGLIVVCAALALPFLVLQPIALLGGIPVGSGFMLEVSTWVGSPAFIGTFLFSAALGLSLIRRNPLGIGGRVLLGVLPAFLLVIALAFISPDWAHPGIAEVVAGVGLALLGAGSARARVVAPSLVESKATA